MGRLVMKFGGTSVADIARIRNVARHVEREVKAGHHVAVVVSALAGTTDRLLINIIHWGGLGLFVLSAVLTITSGVSYFRRYGRVLFS